MLSIVIMERDFQKANYNLRQEGQTLETKLIDNEENVQVKRER